MVGHPLQASLVDAGPSMVLNIYPINNTPTQTLRTQTHASYYEHVLSMVVMVICVISVENQLQYKIISSSHWSKLVNKERRQVSAHMYIRILKRAKLLHSETTSSIALTYYKEQKQDCSHVDHTQLDHPLQFITIYTNIVLGLFGVCGGCTGTL